MNNRRKFLMQTGMAATALLVTKPYNTLAGITNPITGFGSEQKLVFLHTGNVGFSKAALQIESMKQKHKNLMLLHTGDKPAPQLLADYDVQQEETAHCSWKIIHKGSIRTGVISAVISTNVLNEINDLAAYLKKSKNCDIVVCLSGLGYKNKNGIDDVNLAQKSTNLDIIVSGHQKNFSNNSMIVLNQKKQEVIISHSANNKLDLGNVEINFDRNRQKKGIAFHNPFRIHKVI